MNRPLNLQASQSRRPSLARRLILNLAIGLAVLCVGAGLMMPVIKSRSGSHHRMLPGQLHADVRTLISGMRYLLSPELPAEKNPIIVAGNNLALAQSTPVRTLGLPEISCNQTGAPAGPLTNPPVQI
jgi:hypothetical protein